MSLLLSQLTMNKSITSYTMSLYYTVSHMLGLSSLDFQQMKNEKNEEKKSKKC